MNKISIDYKGNEELLALLEGFAPGDEVTLPIKVTVTANDSGYFEGEIDEIQADGKEAEMEDDPEDSPIAVMIMAKKGKKMPVKPSEDDMSTTEVSTSEASTEE
jgi:hypothetical protein